MSTLPRPPTLTLQMRSVTSPVSLDPDSSVSLEAAHRRTKSFGGHSGRQEEMKLKAQQEVRSLLNTFANPPACQRHARPPPPPPPTPNINTDIETNNMVDHHRHHQSQCTGREALSRVR
mmetsp:Transcript_17620/g.46000  ORF Transcript_17620/g.46000 Transcript_17620/m.46000 type:complete len:119 (-) Transcript_17620:5505-5861(-)